MRLDDDVCLALDAKAAKLTAELHGTGKVTVSDLIRRGIDRELHHEEPETSIVAVAAVVQPAARRARAAVAPGARAPSLAAMEAVAAGVGNGAPTCPHPATERRVLAHGTYCDGCGTRVR